MRHLSLLLSAFTIAASTPTSVLAAEPPPHSPVRLETNFQDEDPERSKRIEPVLAKSARDALENRHAVLVDDSATTTIVVYVRNLDENPDQQRAVADYGVRVEVLVDGVTAGDKVLFCTEKGEAELVDCALEGLAPVLEFVPRNRTTSSVPAVEPETPADSEPPTDEVGPIGPAGIVGIVVGASGLALSIAGAVDLARGVVVERGPGASPVRDLRPRGRFLLGTGVGAIAVGAILAGVDVGLRAKKRKRQNAAQLRFTLGSTFAGASLSKRF